MLARKLPGATITTVMKKTAVHHVFLNPVIYLPAFYAFNGALTGQTPDEIVDKAKVGYVPTLQKLWMTWIPSTVIQFYFIPLQHQVLWVSGVSFGWNILLSLLYNEREDNDEA